MMMLDLVGFPDPIARQWRPRPRVRGPRYVVDPETEARLVIEERPADGVAGARRATYLICFFQHGFHRLWRFPNDWLDLSDEDLLRLCWRPRHG